MKFDSAALHDLFAAPFNASNWTDVLADLFGVRHDPNAQLFVRPHALRPTASGDQGFHLGSFTTSDGYLVGLFRYEISSGSVLRRKVGLRALVRPFLGYDYDAALVVFADRDSPAWRFSFVCDIKEEATAPKRFTYVFGDPATPYRTPVERFLKLQESRSESAPVGFSAMQEAFSVEALSDQFYHELFNWFQWALSDSAGVRFPNDTATDRDDRIGIEERVIRLITRLMFVWFIRQKKLVPDELFDVGVLDGLLRDFDPQSKDSGNYYNAILQNLFFATLNNEVSARAFATDKFDARNHAEDYGIKTLFRNPAHDTWFKVPNSKILSLFRPIPFLNGGLFECLDKETPDSNGRIVYTDGFSRNSRRENEHFKYRAFVPNILFFAPDHKEALPSGGRLVETSVCGLLNLLAKYNFTVEENTASDKDVALDPELLGKVFENLLGAYNPETRETVRNQSGSFYTPREEVDFIVDSALRAYLKPFSSSENLAILFSDDDLPPTVLKDERKRLTDALLSVRILDPACGSGAFPMGALNRILQLLRKLGVDTRTDHDLKLHVIENCIYGVDIQTIAVQISKLRFFISLVCEEAPDPSDPTHNYGISPLPNLETKFVAANTLLSRKSDVVMDGRSYVQDSLFADQEIYTLKRTLQDIRDKHFSAKSVTQKREFRRKDADCRRKLVSLLVKDNLFSANAAAQLAAWNPYDQNTSADFFDSEWMFGLDKGFDIVIGNPPYFSLSTDSQIKDSHGRPIKHNAIYAPCHYETFKNTGDIYCLFYERGWQLLKDGGYLCYITSNKWMRAGYGEALRKFLAEKTNPEILVDFAGEKIFESATVDTNILLFQKGIKNKGKTLSVVGSPECRKDLSGFVRQRGFECSFSPSDSWVILSPIEQSIKRKIEAVGTPLKEWDVSINYGIKTGCNEAFIVDEKRRSEILSWCKTSAERKKTDELIRPILRGRDIKRYGYDWAGLYILALFPARHYDIEDFPAIKRHLLSYAVEALVDGGRADLAVEPYLSQFCHAKLEQTGKTVRIGSKPVVLRRNDGKSEEQTARKRTTNKWFETQDTIAYWDDFSRQKLLWAETMRIRKDSDERFPRFSFATHAVFTDKTCFMATGRDLLFALAVLNSKVGRYQFMQTVSMMDNGGYLMQKIYIEQIRLPNAGRNEQAKLSSAVRSLLDGKANETAERAIDEDVAVMFGLSKSERNYLDGLFRRPLARG